MQYCLELKILIARERVRFCAMIKSAAWKMPCINDPIEMIWRFLSVVDENGRGISIK